MGGLFENQCVFIASTRTHVSAPNFVPLSEPVASVSLSLSDRYFYVAVQCFALPFAQRSFEIVFVSLYVSYRESVTSTNREVT